MGQPEASPLVREAPWRRLTRKMAAFSFVVRSRVSSRTILMALRPSKRQITELEASPSMRHVASLRRRSSCAPRLPVSSHCLVSMLPLHSAIASARLRSVLAAESQRWGLVPQAPRTY
ncbi:hypothetical protein MUK42_11659 [Musa troglodytarum]|uniref:Uncharacterized protein n=1 Tax=Musa troglodytarum TaxID=320322 RepID=A0A9E7GTY4_9LILI|nr:hypothetical protein MUK42_11659 [Musa troglodytarum]